ncbi:MULTISPECIES: VOC family protein [unclassified Paenibacillus]|uniref:VOC family protein n=1 Tax=unclassified Paenibacillus TaxID=185978 RepID=UPI000956693B|nr:MULTISPECIES: VOC family protein [unclassified Paenibacillus]ASS67539.1 VOC family protein [Paenibacillus sp. RUD330]SIQ73475.1 Glyoxalase superfamily enzyme, possibly 3-demethylubiquinone-9 3-methyltransferase [Paenibacillus sp. RU4X]SIQ94889.1 Glyoxalase superfamily enzyme, possibly 3-demethylubiquinone-9 3-methyltransferase [Paenibacillus sp. RU4T]
MNKVTPFLMFEGNAEAAMKVYVSVIEDSEIKSITRYGADEPGPEGTVKQAVFSLKGQEIMCIDSFVKHAFTFTPSFSLFLACDTEEEVERVFARLSEDGEVLMPLGEYPFSRKFGWIVDKFGVSWQLALPQ